MKRGSKSWLLRALLVVGVVLFAGLAWVGVEAVRGPVVPVEEHRVFDDRLFAAESSPSLAPEDAGRADALEVVLTLEEGDHRVRGGAPGGAVRVDAKYDSANYELSTRVEDRAGRLPRYEVEFQRTTSALRSLLTSMRHALVENHLEFSLPEGVPIDLTLRLRRGDFRIDLSGLSIARLRIDGGMGEVRVVFDEQNPIEMSSLEADMRMGDMRLRGLGHADARRIDVHGRMGEAMLDFEGSLRSDCEVTVDFAMGSCDLDVPQGQPFEVVDTSSMMGGVDVRRDTGEGVADPGLVPPARLLLDLSVRMGEVSVH